MAGTDKVLWTFFLTDFLFLLSGGLLIGFALECQAKIASTPTQDTVVEDLLLVDAPLNATIVNAVVIFVTFLVSVPATIMPTSRGWLKLHGFLAFICLMFTLVLGLVIWFRTLTSRTNLLETWTAQPISTQSLLQQKLDCCGYLNSATPIFALDAVCSSPAQAALKIGCVGPFSTFANNYLDLIFTAAFGVVGIDVALILAVAMLLKDRKEKERYRHIDQKNGGI